MGGFGPQFSTSRGAFSACRGIIPRPGRDLGPPDPDRDRAQGTPDPGRDLGELIRINRGKVRGPWARFTFREGQELEGQELEGQELEGQELGGVR